MKPSQAPPREYVPISRTVLAPEEPTLDRARSLGTRMIVLLLGTRWYCTSNRREARLPGVDWGA